MNEQATIKHVLLSETGVKLPLELRIRRYCADIKRLVEVEHVNYTDIIKVLVKTNILSKKCQIRDLDKIISKPFTGAQQPLPIVYDTCKFLAPDPAMFASESSIEGDSHGD